MTEPAIMQLENERARLVVTGKRTDDNTTCTLLVTRETSGHWCLYTHGVGTLGVRLPKAEAERLARAMLADGAQ